MRRWLGLVWMVGASRGCGPSMSARAWPEADALFHRDARWLGGDAAYSVADETLYYPRFVRVE